MECVKVLLLAANVIPANAGIQKSTFKLSDKI
jgi:hypothetical protein